MRWRIYRLQPGSLEPGPATDAYGGSFAEDVAGCYRHARRIDRLHGDSEPLVIAYRDGSMAGVGELLIDLSIVIGCPAVRNGIESFRRRKPTVGSEMVAALHRATLSSILLAWRSWCYLITSCKGSTMRRDSSNLQ